MAIQIKTPTNRLLLLETKEGRVMMVRLQMQNKIKLPLPRTKIENQLDHRPRKIRILLKRILDRSKLTLRRLTKSH